MEIPPPQPKACEVLIQIRCSAICRTDLHVIEGELPRRRLPIIPGHQIVGEVAALGDACRTLRIGQRVGVAWLRHTCGACEFCQAGKENLCDASRYTGYHADGGYAEFAVVPEEFAFSIPDALKDEEAAPLLCAGIIGYRALARSNLPPGGSLAIFGFGSSAHVVMQLARRRASSVFVVTRGEGHRVLARRMGADWVGETILGMPALVDSAIIFAPAGDLVPAALGCLKKGGTLALAGIHMGLIPAMEYDSTLCFERDLRSVTANTREDGRSLLAEAAKIPIRPHIKSYPLEAANRAFQDLKAARINGTGLLTMRPTS